MKDKVKNYLKNKNKFEIKELIKHPDLSETEKWVIYYAFGEDRYIANICIKLNISERQYHIIKDQALIKLYYILKL